MNFLRSLFGKKERPVREEDRFAQLVISALNHKDSEIRVDYDPEAFELHHVDEIGRGNRTFLHNSFAEYMRLDGKERAQHVDNVARFIIESRNPRPTGEAALDTLLPVVRPRADILAATADAKDFLYERSSRPFCGSMLLMLALDSDISISLVTDETLDELGVSFDNALGIATAQLNEMGQHTFGQLADGTFVSNCGDHYDASRVLLPDLFLQLPLKGNPVVIIQSRACVLVTGSEDVDGLKMIAEFALEDFENMERAVSLTPIEWCEDQWRVFPVQPDHPLALRNLAPNQQCWSYGATREELQKKLGDEVFVANAMLLEKDGELATIASWGNGVTTACPLVDAIMIQEDGDFPELVRSLGDVLKVAGPFQEIEAMSYPARWLLPAHITVDQRRQLAEHFDDFLLFPSDNDHD